MVTLNLPVVMVIPPLYELAQSMAHDLNLFDPSDKIKGKCIGWSNTEYIAIFYTGYMPKKSVVNSLVKSAGLTLTKF